MYDFPTHILVPHPTTGEERITAVEGFVCPNCGRTYHDYSDLNDTEMPWTTNEDGSSTLLCECGEEWHEAPRILYGPQP